MDSESFYMVWPDDWRAVHFLAKDKKNPEILLEPLDRNLHWVLVIDGDCGMVWGEPKEDACNLWHVQVYCPGENVAAVLRCLRDKNTTNPITGKPLNQYVVVTDPNDWSRKQNSISWPDGRKCTNPAHK